jgi:hypothetical protein
MATINITLKDEANNIEIQSVCDETSDTVTPAMAMAFQIMKLASEMNEMPKVQQGVESL